jgi:hypothetical protein
MINAMKWICAYPFNFFFKSSLTCIKAKRIGA